MSQDQSRLDRENPFLGLRPFSENEQAFFKGREREIRDLLRRIHRNTLTILFGVSGLGKTSLLMAGVFPRAREQGYFPILVRLDYGDNVKSGTEQVKDAIRATLEQDGVEGPEPEEDETLWGYFHRAQFWSARNQLLVPVLVFDQFEELFTLGQQRPTVARFIDELEYLIENRIPAAERKRFAEAEELPFSIDQQNFRVVFSLREDYLPEFESLRRQIPSINNNRMRLLPMNGKAALSVVAQVPELIEADVAEQVVRFVAAGESESLALDDFNIEPALLSVFCRELNNKRKARGDRQITAQLLQGSKEQILNDFYENSVQDVSEEVRRFIEEEMLTKTGHRNSVALEDALDRPGVEAETIQRLVDDRLIRVEERAGVERIELTHDLLTQVIRASRDERREREARREESEALQRAEAEASLARKKLRQSRVILAGYALLSIVAAITGYYWLKAQQKVEATVDTAYSITGAVMELQALLERGESDTVNLAELRRTAQPIFDAMQIMDEGFISHYLLEADVLVEADILIEPQGVDALELYEKVLNIEVDNEEALRGLQTIADRFEELATEAMVDGEYNEAATLSQNGLKAVPDHVNLLAIREQVMEQLDQSERRIQELIELADNLVATGAFLPMQGQCDESEGPNAMQAYQELQQLDRENPAADRGLQRLPEQVNEEIKQLRGLNLLVRARDLAVAAQSCFPQRSEFSKHAEALNEAVAIQARQQPFRDIMAQPFSLDTLDQAVLELQAFTREYPGQQIAYLEMRDQLIEKVTGEAEKIGFGGNEGSGIFLIEKALAHFPDNMSLTTAMQNMEEARRKRLLESTGELAIVGLPWGEVIDICLDRPGDTPVCSGDTEGLQALPEDRSTPLVVNLLEGDYTLSIRPGDGGEAVTVPVTVTAQERVTERVHFGSLDAEDYFRRSAW